MTSLSRWRPWRHYTKNTAAIWKVHIIIIPGVRCIRRLPSYQFCVQFLIHWRWYLLVSVISLYDTDCQMDVKVLCYCNYFLFAGSRTGGAAAWARWAMDHPKFWLRGPQCIFHWYRVLIKQDVTSLHLPETRITLYRNVLPLSREYSSNWWY